MDLSEPEQIILQRYFDDGRLTAVPARGRKRELLLRYLAVRFQPDRSYTEREVNSLLGEFHEDMAALRRYLVDGGYLDREPPGIYRRPRTT